MIAIRTDVHESPMVRPEQRRLTIVTYWAISGPLLLCALIGGGMDLTQSQHMRETLVHLGYPLYLLTILGLTKILAVPALIVMRFPRLTEWAYAGLFFVFAGAACSHFAAGDSAVKITMPLLFAALTLASSAMRPGVSVNREHFPFDNET